LETEQSRDHLADDEEKGDDPESGGETAAPNT
jgi:hypothetical protein